MWALLRANHAFRRLWLAQVVSSAGDWLNRMAVLALIRHHGDGSAVGMLFGVELALRLLPTTLIGPIAGPVADRLSRRGTMITADLARALVVLAFLFVDGPEDLPVLYGVLVLQMVLGPFHDAANSACIPGVVGRDHLHAAYALTAVTWSTMLALGAFVGGVLLKVIGADGVFIADAVTYVLSALLLVGLRLPPMPSQPDRWSWRRVLLLGELRGALRHLRSRGALLAVTAKWHWSVAGGFLVCLPMLAPRLGGDADLGETGFAIALLYAARGVGTGIGPLLARRIGGSGERALIRSTASGFLAAGLGYLAVATVEGGLATWVLVLLAHTGGSTIWVSSTTLWQRAIDDGWRGRVVTLEQIGLTLLFTLVGLATGAGFDAGWTPSQVVGLLAGTTLLSGAAWALAARRARWSEQPAETVA